MLAGRWFSRQIKFKYYKQCPGLLSKHETKEIYIYEITIIKQYYSNIQRSEDFFKFKSGIDEDYIWTVLCWSYSMKCEGYTL